MNTLMLKGEQMGGIALYEQLPVGTFIEYAGSKAPVGFKKCDGTEISRSNYGELFNIIGTTYGPGDGATTFNLPNLTGTNGIICIKASAVTSKDPDLINDTVTDVGHTWSSDKINGALANFDISIESPRCNIHDGAISKCTKIGIKTYSVSCRIKFGTAKGSEGDNDLYVTLPYFNGYTTQDSYIGTGTYYVDETYNGMVFVGVLDNKLQLLFPNLILKRRVKPNDITNKYFNINCIIQDCR